MPVQSWRGLVIAMGFMLVSVDGAAAEDRLVAIGGDVTEIVYALGAGDRLIAVDSTSTFPAAADALPDLGYLRRLAAEPIVAAAPDVVLMSEAAGPPVVIDQLRAAGLALVMVPQAPDVAGVVAKIATVGQALGLEAAALELAAAVEQQVARTQAAVAAVEARPRVLFVLNIGRGAPLTSGEATSAASIIQLAGGRNAIDGFEGYRPLSREAAIAAAPDVVLVPTTTLEALGGPEAVLARPELRASPAAADGNVVAMDPLLLLGFGPRLAAAVTTLAQALHPDLPVGHP